MIDIYPVFLGPAGQIDITGVSLLSILGGVAVSFGSAILVYVARQVWERKKLERALLTEVEEMDGIKDCAAQMSRIAAPPGRQLRPDDVPTSDSIPTTVYRNSTSKIGLMGGFRRGEELRGVVRFYSKVLRYKSIIRDIEQSVPASGATTDGGARSRAATKFNSAVSDNDQEQLYNDIESLEAVRQDIIETKSFDVEYPSQLTD